MGSPFQNFSSYTLGGTVSQVLVHIGGQRQSWFHQPESLEPWDWWALVVWPRHWNPSSQNIQAGGSLEMSKLLQGGR